LFFFFSSRRRHTRSDRDWSSDVCSSDLLQQLSESTRSPARLAGVLALGFRLTVPQCAKPLPDNFPLNPKGFNAKVQYADGIENRSEERRVGKECRSRWARDG